MDKQGYMMTCGECDGLVIGGETYHNADCRHYTGKGRSVPVSSAHPRTPDEEITELQSELHNYAKTADRRLALLRLWNDKRVEKGRYCPFCFVAPISVLNPKEDSEPGRYVLYHYEDSHSADGCELAEELKDDAEKES